MTIQRCAAIIGAAALLLVGVIGFSGCGGGGEATAANQQAQESAAEAKRELLELEKETAEREAEKAKAEAEKAQAKKAQAEQAQAEKAQAEKAQQESEPEAAPETAEVPNVVGMRLPQAEVTLSAAGYATEAENTDTTFGIVIPSHYTICEQSEPQGEVVTVLAQKYGC